jgi:hypothetical protein
MPKLGARAALAAKAWSHQWLGMLSRRCPRGYPVIGSAAKAWHPAWLVALFIFCAWGPAAGAASPNLGNIAPRGGQRGTEMAILFSGARLSDAKDIFF